MTSYTIHCPQHLNITMVEGFRESLQAALDTSGECILNISLVEKVDSVGMQILIVFQEAMEKQGGVVRYKGESEVFMKTASILGLSHYFKPDSVTSQRMQGVGA
jgi:anti-anti-sigma regulatory factor